MNFTHKKNVARQQSYLTRLDLRTQYNLGICTRYNRPKIGINFSQKAKPYVNLEYFFLI